MAATSLAADMTIGPVGARGQGLTAAEYAPVTNTAEFDGAGPVALNGGLRLLVSNCITADVDMGADWSQLSDLGCLTLWLVPHLAFNGLKSEWIPKFRTADRTDGLGKKVCLYAYQWV